MSDLTPEKVREWLRWPLNSDQGRQLAEGWLRLHEENERLRALDHPHVAWEMGRKACWNEVSDALGGDRNANKSNPYPKPDDPPRPQLSRDAVVECVQAAVVETCPNHGGKKLGGIGEQCGCLACSVGVRLRAALAKLEVE